MQSTGLADALALVLQQGLAGWPSYAALMVVFIGTTLLTQVMSNAASVGWQMSRATGRSAVSHRLADPVLFGASQSFLTRGTRPI